MSDTDQQYDISLYLPVSDEVVLWRRVPAEKKVYDANLGRVRPTSDVFGDHRDGSSMSVYDSERCGGIEAVMSGHDGFLLCAFNVATARSLNMVVVRTGSGGPGHCEVIGKKTGSVKDKLAKASEWVIAP